MDTETKSEPRNNVPEHIAVVADDLTGACDAGVAFLRSGARVRVWLGARAHFVCRESVQVYNTQSRALDAEDAGRAVRGTIRGIGRLRDLFLFKKVDSAARGPWAAEILAAHEASGAVATVVAPAFPEHGRTVRNGILRVQDAAGQNAHVELATLFPRDVQPRIGLISDPAELEPAMQSGKTLLLCDTADASELDAVARTTLEIPHLLCAGSGGLAHALAEQFGDAEPKVPTPCEGAILVIAGTPHPVTQLQLAQLEATRTDGIRILRVECAAGDGQTIRATFDELHPRAAILTGGDTALFACRALEAHSFILHGALGPGIPWGTIQGGEADGCLVVTKSGGFGSQSAIVDVIDTLRGNA